MTFICCVALCFSIHALSERTTKNGMKMDTYYQRQRCSAMTVSLYSFWQYKVCADIRGGSWRRGVKRFRWRRFSGFSDAIRLFVILGNDALNGHFTLNFHYYEQQFQKLSYILTVEPIYRIFLLYHVTSRDAEADRDLQNISDPQKDCRSFIDEKSRRYIVGTLTNKANIIM